MKDDEKKKKKKNRVRVRARVDGHSDVFRRLIGRDVQDIKQKIDNLKKKKMKLQQKKLIF
jgi:hypothetical protein